MLHKYMEIASRLCVVVSDAWAALTVIERPNCSDYVYSKLCARTTAEKRQTAVLENGVGILDAATVEKENINKTAEAQYIETGRGCALSPRASARKRMPGVHTLTRPFWS